MAALTRFKTKYPGVYYIEGKSIAKGKPEKIFYIRYRVNGKQVEEKAGRQYQDDMTAAKAATLRSEKIEGKKRPNTAGREEARKIKWTIDRLWEEYKSHKQVNKALRVDDGRYVNYIKPLLGNKEPRDLCSLDVRRLTSRLTKTLAPQTVKHILGILKRIVNYGFNEGLTARINFKIEMPRVDNRVTEDLNPEELSRLINAIETDRNSDVATMMLIALFTGMRRGEIFKLKWEDISFHRSFILIRDPKGKKDQRIPLNNDAKGIFEHHPKTKSPYVFPGNNGKQRVSAAKAARRIRESAGLSEKFRPFHGLRHTYASMLASSGQVDMYTLQKLLTHKSPQMTQRYAHLRDETLKKAADLAGDIITHAMEGQKEPIPLAKVGEI